MAKVRVLLFAALRERLGAASLDLDLPADASVADVLATLERSASGLVGQRFAVALNQRYVDRAALVSDGDELALIPPVSGG